MGRYDNEVIYNRETINGDTRHALTIRVIDRSYEKSKAMIHIVKYGETLFSIADKYYNDFKLWFLIADKNPSISNPFELEANQEIIIPDRSEYDG